VRVDCDGRSGSAVVSSSGRSSARVVAMRGRTSMAPRAARSYAPSPATTRRSRAAGGAARGFSLGVDVLRGVTRPWSHCMEAPATTDGAGGAAESGRRHPAEGCAVLTPRGPL